MLHSVVQHRHGPQAVGVDEDAVVGPERVGLLHGEVAADGRLLPCVVESHREHVILRRIPFSVWPAWCSIVPNEVYLVVLPQLDEAFFPVGHQVEVPVLPHLEGLCRTSCRVSELPVVRRDAVEGGDALGGRCDVGGRRRDRGDAVVERRDRVDASERCDRADESVHCWTLCMIGVNASERCDRCIAGPCGIGLRSGRHLRHAAVWSREGYGK